MNTTETTRRVRETHSQIALRLREMARDAGDVAVHAACNRVRQGWLLGHRVEASDLLLITEMWEAVRG